MFLDFRRLSRKFLDFLDVFLDVVVDLIDFISKSSKRNNGGVLNSVVNEKQYTNSANHD